MRLGHVDLKVADLERAVRFYCDVLGFTVAERSDEASIAFLRAEGDGAFHLALTAGESLGGAPPPPGSTGLDYVALLYPDRGALAAACRGLIEAGAPIERFDDHGVGESLYARDPDGNGLELYWERPRAAWPREDGELAMFTRPLELGDLVASSL
ncbi:MAG TPA: VOC family protein [Gaiella sp.]|jgi:catechol 2,3-dioxygenase